MPRPRTSTADLGGRSDALKPLPWTREQREYLERQAHAYVERKLPDGEARLEVLQMLGLAREQRAKAPRKPRERVDPKHGLRSTYTNHRCRCEDCVRANSDYFKRKEAA